MHNEIDSIKSTIEIDFNQIQIFADKISQKHQQIKAIYLFGSVARRDADEMSDIDLFFLVKDNSSDFLAILCRDADYRIFEGWALERVEGGLSPLVCDKDELINDFDTLIEKILLEGIRLYGQDLKRVKSRTQNERKVNKSNLLDLVRSL